MSDICAILQRDIYPCLPPSLSSVLKAVPADIMSDTYEIRLRINQPLALVVPSGDVLVNSQGLPVAAPTEAYCCSREDLNRTLQIMSRNSVYALERELQQGFLTLSGGHRVGLAGQTIIEDSRIKTMKCVTSMNIRLAREVKGCADKVMPYIIADGRILNTLVISPPRCGKTTLLRDIARQVSSGVSSIGFKGVQTGVVDERSEIAACLDGVPSMDLGRRTDVLDGCPKAYGMLMFIRSMAPGVIITDELGRNEDAEAIKEALHAGIAVIASVHGRSVSEVRERPYIGELIARCWFERYIILGNQPRPGALAGVCGKKPEEVLFQAKRG
ncbi:MAG: stage III sporulation protein AA [Negativicutes bacterium]|nr:stage III sporulation protein AA [Negativicutes bacterium]